MYKILLKILCCSYSVIVCHSFTSVGETGLLSSAHECKCAITIWCYLKLSKNVECFYIIFVCFMMFAVLQRYLTLQRHVTPVEVCKLFI